jgi:hypothetical protein
MLLVKYLIHFLVAKKKENDVCSNDIAFSNKAVTRE